MAVRKKKKQTPEELAVTQAAKQKIASQRAVKVKTPEAGTTVTPTVTPKITPRLPEDQKTIDTGNLTGIIDSGTAAQQTEDIAALLGTDVDLSPEGLLEERKETKARQKLRKQQDLAKQKADEERLRAEDTEAAARTESARLGTLQTGVTGTGAGTQAGAAIQTATQRTTQAIQRRQVAVDQNIQRQEQDLAQAIKSGDVQAADTIRRRLQAAQDQQSLVTEQLAKLEREKEQMGVKNFENALNLITNMPASALTTPEAITSIFGGLGAEIDPITASGLAAKYTNVAELAKKDQEMADLEMKKLQAEIGQIGVKEKTQSQQDFQFYQTLKGEDREAFGRMKGFTEADLTELQKAQATKARAEATKIRAEAAEIQGEIDPAYTTTLTSIDIPTVGTGDALPLNTLGDSSKKMRTDRHNNPIADKAYKVSVDRLKTAGLEQGIDFNLGETTEGIDTDGVPTIMYKDAETGTKGAIVGLQSGLIGSWYANPKYGGSGKIIDKLSNLSGKAVNQSNAQEVFNSLDGKSKTEIVKEIYAHEGGTQMFLPSKVSTEYNKSLVPLYSKYNASKFNSSDWKAVDELGLSANEFVQQAKNSKDDIDSSGKQFAKDILAVAKNLKNKDGRTTAAFGLDFIPFTDAKDFQRSLDSFKSKLSLQNLVDLKSQGATFGALSDNELRFITDSSSKLDKGMSDEDWEVELDRIIEKMTKVVGISSDLEQEPTQGLPLELQQYEFLTDGETKADKYRDK